jgi:hypothetical protein
MRARAQARSAQRQAPGGRCTVCRKRKHKVHRNRKTGRLVCPACADRARMRIGPCDDCGARKLLQARRRCFACYKRHWRAARAAPAPLRAGARR